MPKNPALHPFPPVDAARCVRSPDGRLIADFHAKLPCTRPLWLGMRPDVIRRAVTHNLAGAWFGAPTLSGEPFMAQCRASAERAAYDTLPMLHKSGLCVLGLEGVWQAFDAGALRLAVVASDAGASDSRKLLNHADYGRRCYQWGEKTRLGKVFGRRAQVFIGVAHGELAEKLAFFLRCNTGFS